jgi:hypothetical protein
MDITYMFSQIFGENGFLSHLYFEGMFTRKLTEQQINKIPLINFDIDQNNLNNQCSICCAEFCNNQLLRHTQCNHNFHQECLDNWLLNYHEICPICRTKLD